MVMYFFPQRSRVPIGALRVCCTALPSAMRGLVWETLLQSGAHGVVGSGLALSGPEVTSEVLQGEDEDPAATPGAHSPSAWPEWMGQP